MLNYDTAVLHRPTVRVTPKGQAVAAVYKLLALLRQLDAAERADVVELLALELSEQGLND